MANVHDAHEKHLGSGNGFHGRPYLMFWVNMVLGPVDKVWQPYLCGGQGKEC